MHRFRLAVMVCVLGAILTGCQPTRLATPAPVSEAVDFTQPLPTGEVALRRIEPSQYPDFAAALPLINVRDLRQSAENSLLWFKRAGSAKKYPYLDIDHARARASAQALIALIDSGAFTLDRRQFNQRIADTFQVYQSVGAPAPGGAGYTKQVLFTGYFTPTYDASLTRQGDFQWPLYKRPADLVTDAEHDAAFRKSADGSLAPYPTRQEIESGGLAGDELIWLNSRWNAYVVTVQGSARLRLTDGQIIQVGYGGSNGLTYESPGLSMANDGLIARKDLSFETMRKYFAEHPEAMDTYLWKNKRTVFFQQESGAAVGALNVPVTRLATIATDKDVYPPGMPAFLSMPPRGAGSQARGASSPAASAGTLPNDAGAGEFAAFVMDQDRGGAIRSAGRCDIYMGVGESAEQTAGRQLNAGRLYYLAAKETVARQ